MSAIRYSGALRIRVTYIEDWTKGPAEYRCHISCPSLRGHQPVTIYVHPRVVETHARDSSVAFDAIAHAALNLAADMGWPIESCAHVDAGGWAVSRTPVAPTRGPHGTVIVTARRPRYPRAMPKSRSGTASLKG